MSDCPDLPIAAVNFLCITTAHVPQYYDAIKRKRWRVKCSNSSKVVVLAEILSPYFNFPLLLAVLHRRFFGDSGAKVSTATEWGEARRELR